jgi:putative (di)nucleoside polyphosphate hydrolase
MAGSSKVTSHDHLGDLLADPLIQLVMKADNVDARDIEALYGQMHRNGNRGGRGRLAGSELGSVAIRPDEDINYRSGVGVMLLNSRNQIFVGRRLGSDDAWQMPQGGIESGEPPYAAALRELREEIGTDDVELLATSKGWLRYDLPPELIGKAWGGRWRGQQQKWFGFRFKGSDADINIATEHPEFCAWRWSPAAEVADLIVAFKRQLYLNVLDEFRDIHTAECL